MSSIRELCDGWNQSVVSDGGISIGGASEAFRLHRNGVQFHELTFAELRDAIVGLTINLLLPGMNTVIDLDHVLMWSWCGELLLGGGGPLSTHIEPEVSRLAAVTVRASLANSRFPSDDAFVRARKASDLMEHNDREYLQHSHDALAYLAFPFLEAVTRRACVQYVDLTGKVQLPFARGSGTYSVGGRCSSVGDLLELLVGTVASPGLKADLMELLSHVHGLQPEFESGSAVIFDWRNSSLHGVATLPTIGGTVLSLALRIALDALRDDYSLRRQEATQSIQRATHQSTSLGAAWRPGSWNYYPPFW